ncbi:hypothetical protein [Schinkia azotoformans]|uniref:hypothetical protein n=1 Tax=Schinkia azotoformans TaxID=1454 RepID=UPI002E24D1BE|nr:hypothetical protein [Schinkia azotoformans]
MSFKQLERCYFVHELPDVYVQIIDSGKINDIDFVNEAEKNYFITSLICKSYIKDIRYKRNIHDYLNNAYGYFYGQKDWLSYNDIFETLFEKELYQFYSIYEFIVEEDCIQNLFVNLKLEDLVCTINLLQECYEKYNLEVIWFKSLCKNMLNDAISLYTEYIDVTDYCYNYDINDLLNKNSKPWYCGDDVEYDIDKEAVVQELEQRIEEDIKDEVQNILANLNNSIICYTDLSNTFIVNSYDIDRAIDSYFEPGEIDYEGRGNTNSKESYIYEIEAIFER